MFIFGGVNFDPSHQHHHHHHHLGMELNPEPQKWKWNPSNQYHEQSQAIVRILIHNTEKYWKNPEKKSASQGRVLSVIQGPIKPTEKIRWEIEGQKDKEEGRRTWRTWREKGITYSKKIKVKNIFGAKIGANSSGMILCPDCVGSKVR